MNYMIFYKEIFGIKNPKVRMKIKNDYKIDKLEIYLNNKIYKNYNDEEVIIDYNMLTIDLTLPINTSTIRIILYSDGDNIVILDKRYDYFVRGAKVLTKPFRIIGDQIWIRVKPIIKTVKLMWTRHHFLIPPKKLKRYLHSFVQNYKYPEVNDFYNPEIKKDYNNWLKEQNVCFKMKQLDYNPLISVIIPVYNVNDKYLDECIKSVLKQTYQNYEICIADDNSSDESTIMTLKKYENNPKIKIKYRDVNGMISKCMNDAIEMASGDYVGFLDNDDVLDENALYFMVKELNNNKAIDMVYSDEDKIDGNQFCDVNFKPDWSPDTLLSMNYICHFTIIRKKIGDELGWFRSDYDGSQDYDLFLRVTEKTSNISHVSKVLYHWRKSETSTAASNSNKNYARIAGKKALEAALQRRNIKGIVKLDEKSPFYIIDYIIDPEPKVSIIIPTKDHKDILEKCITSIYDKTSYKNFEIIVVDNNTTEKTAVEYLNGLEKKYVNIKVMHDHSEFNYSRINNNAIKQTDSDYILLLNNDTEVITPNWLRTMVGYAMQDHVGCVGVKLLYPDETIQHAGVILGLGGVASHAYIGSGRNSLGYFGRLCVPYNYSANTAACLMVSRKKFDEVNGLEEDLKVAYNDVDFNIKLLEKGYYNVFLPQVELFHYESKSRGQDIEGEKKKRFDSEVKYMMDKWGKKIYNDKFYNKNFSLKGWFLLDRRK